MSQVFPIVDLHCDLLEYLARSFERTPFEERSRCAYPQLKEGGVRLQIAAIFTETKPGSTHRSQAQIDRFLQLPLECPGQFSHGMPTDSQAIFLLPALENASSAAEETEPFSQIIQRLETWQKILPRFAYISLTWNGENRFGGGVGSNKGVTDEGKQLVDWMCARGIAVDLSHASDRLAEEILNHTEQHNLPLRLLASHSNFRSICSHLRNLPDWLAQEIIHRKGLIGLNLFSPFLHPTDSEAFVRHIEYGLSLHGEDSLSFGADFFDSEDFAALLAKHGCAQPYFSGYDTAACYQKLLETCARKLSLSPELLMKIASGNALTFFKGG